MDKENNQIVLIFVISAAIIIVLAIIVMLFLVIYQKRIVTQEHQLQKIENERQQLLLKATIEGQERERKRLAKDLHDGIGSLLSGLSLNLKFQKRKENPNSEQFAFLNEACKLVEESIENVRNVSHNLMPSTLEDFGLVSAMQECIAAIKKNRNIEIQIKAPKAKLEIPNTTALGLLRIFQELIQNTIKHANASKINTELALTNNCITLTYRDNGTGFNPKTKASKGIGIKNIQSRTQALNGIFNIDHISYTGFIAFIEIPLNSKEDK